MKELFKFFRDPRFYIPVLFFVLFEGFLQTGYYRPLMEPHSYADNVNKIVRRIRESNIKADTLILGTSVAYQGVSPQRLNELLADEGRLVLSGAAEGAMIETQHMIFKAVAPDMPRLKTVLHVSEVTFPWTSRYHQDPANRAMAAQFPRTMAIPLLREYGFKLTAYDYLYFTFRSMSYQGDMRDAVLGPLNRLKAIGRRMKEPHNDYVYENVEEFMLSSYPSKNLIECMKVAEKGIPEVDATGKKVTDRHHKFAVFRTCQVGLDDPFNRPGAPQWAELYFKRWAKFYADAKSRGIEVITVLPPYSDLISDFNADARMKVWQEQLEKIRGKGNVEIIDLRRSLDGPNNKDLYYDTIHLNRFGARAFSEKLAEALRRNAAYQKGKP